MTLSARLWDAMYRGSPSWELGGADPVLCAALDERLLTPGLALDVGCGTGDNAIELARRGFDVVAIDVSERALRRAREKADVARVSVEFIAADAASLPLADRFDLIVDRGLLMSLAGERARRRYVRSLEDRCAPGGSIYSAQWVVPQGTRSPSVWGLSRLSIAVVRPAEMQERFGANFAIAVVHSDAISVDDAWLRRLGLRHVANVSYWMQRRSAHEG
jgi:SAM-dependent methyltransferase